MTLCQMDKRERKRLVKLIASDSTGIYGVSVCQLCGEFGSFRGLAAAQGYHWLHEFVALSHGHVRADGRSRSSYSSEGAFRRLEKLLKKSPDRFCEVCQKRVPRATATRDGRSWLC